MSTIKKQRVTLFINHKILKQAKAQAIIDEVILSKLVENALIKYLPTETRIQKPEF